MRALKNERTLHLVLYLVLALWSVSALYISSERSFWQDEMLRYWQMNMGIGESFVSLFQEPSPFAPGEIILGHLSRYTFGWFTSFEFWTRIPSVLWGALTIWLAVEARSLSLTLLLALSVAMIQFSTQFRPYAALIFNGALAFRMLVEERPMSPRAERFLFWFGLIFGHIYGICYQAMAAFLRRQWLRTIVAGLYVLAIIVIYMQFHEGSVVVWKPRDPHFDWMHFAQLTIRTLGNPYGMTFILFPFAVLGGLLTLTKGTAMSIRMACFFFATIAGPLIANFIGNYPFVPRQIVSVIFPYLFFVAIGFDFVAEKSKKIAWLAPVIGLLLITGMARSWLIYVTDGRPPYVEQPLHKHKQRVRASIDAGDRNVLLLDPGGTAYFYFEQAFGKPPVVTQVQRGSHPINVCCWGEYCVHHFNVSEYAWKDINDLATNAEFMAYVNGTDPKFDRVLYNAYELTLPTSAPTERLW